MEIGEGRGDEAGSSGLSDLEASAVTMPVGPYLSVSTFSLKFSRNLHSTFVLSEVRVARVGCCGVLHRYPGGRWPVLLFQEPSTAFRSYPGGLLPSRGVRHTVVLTAAPRPLYQFSSFPVLIPVRQARQARVCKGNHGHHPLLTSGSSLPRTGSPTMRSER